MQPGVSEQLTASAATLRRAVLPHCDDEAAGATLTALANNLQMVADHWSDVLPFLTWDNERMLELLGQLDGAPPVPEDLDPLDVDQVDRLNQTLRRELSRVLTDPSQDATLTVVRHRVVAHLDQRARRYPFRAVPAMPPRPADESR